jgi:hypothetical protein
VQIQAQATQTPKHAGVQQQQQRSAESAAVSKTKPQLGPGPGPQQQQQQQQPNRENTKKRPPVGAVFLAKAVHQENPARDLHVWAARSWLAPSSSLAFLIFAASPRLGKTQNNAAAGAPAPPAPRPTAPTHTPGFDYSRRSFMS